MELDPQSSAPRRVEAYLDQVLAPLTHRLPLFHQQELRRELRTHLGERISAYQELGMTEDAAVTEALRQFGGAEGFLEHWKQKWAPLSGPLTLRVLYEAGKSALRPSLQGIVGINLLYIVIQESIWHFPNFPAVKFINHYSDALGLSLAGFAFLLLPLVVGTRYGRRTSERAGVGMAAALFAEIAAVSLIYGAAALLVDTGPSNGITVTDMLFNFLLALLAVWVPVAGGAAAFSGWWTQKHRKEQVTA